ncbi:MAG: hypothetical protein ACJAUP_002178 [Cellvibrionaceae bacterium]|jgi:hypothetical protein
MDDNLREVDNMFFTSRKQHLAEKAREIHVSELSKLTQLHGLCSGFGFAVLSLEGISATPKKYVLCDVGLTKGNTESLEKVTPEFDSLIELEAHAEEYVVEIVQKYIFGNDDSFEGTHTSVF